MGYQIQLSDGTWLTTIPDNTFDSHSTSLTLVGQNTTDYGVVFNDNFVHLLENSAGSTAPTAPLVGQIFFRAGTNVLQVCTAKAIPPAGATWETLAYTSQLPAVTFLDLTGVTQTDSSVPGYGLLAPLYSPVFTGTPTANTRTTGDISLALATTAFVHTAIATISTGVVSVLGQTGAVTLTDLTAPPTGGGLAPITSPVFTGTPTASTQTTGDSSLALATTAFVANSLDARLTLGGLTGLGLAPAANPTFSGTPTAPTASLTSATSGQLATTAYVANSLASFSAASPNMLLNPYLTLQQMNAPGVNVSGTNLNSYLNDGWLVNCVGAPNMTASTVQLTSLDPGPSTGVGNATAQYAFRVATTAPTGVGDYALLSQRVENNYLFSNRYVVVSFWAYASVSAVNICVEFAQYFGTGGTPHATIPGIGANSGTFALSNIWHYYSTAPILIPSVAGLSFGSANTDYLALRIWLTAGSTIGALEANNLGSQAFTLTLWNPQLQIATAASPAPPRAPSVELAMAQRYYETSGFSYEGYNTAAAMSAQNIPFKVMKNVIPTLTMTGTTVTNCSVASVVGPNSWSLNATNIAAGAFSVFGTWIADARL